MSVSFAQNGAAGLTQGCLVGDSSPASNAPAKLHRLGSAADASNIGDQAALDTGPFPNSTRRVGEGLSLHTSTSQRSTGISTTPPATPLVLKSTSALGPNVGPDELGAL